MKSFSKILQDPLPAHPKIIIIYYQIWAYVIIVKINIHWYVEQKFNDCEYLYNENATSCVCEVVRGV